MEGGGTEKKDGGSVWELNGTGLESVAQHLLKNTFIWVSHTGVKLLERIGPRESPSRTFYGCISYPSRALL